MASSANWFIASVCSALKTLSQPTAFFWPAPLAATHSSTSCAVYGETSSLPPGSHPELSPHQLRHSFGTEMLRAGVTLPAVMKLLGHVNPEMTMRYLDVALLDLQREFNLARSQPRHLVPAPRLPASVGQPNVIGLLDSLNVAQHVLEMFRRTLPQGPDRSLLDRLANRLTKIASEARKLQQR